MPADDYIRGVLNYMDILKKDFDVASEDIKRAKHIVKKNGWIPADPKVYAGVVLISLGYNKIEEYIFGETVRKVKERLNLL